MRNRFPPFCVYLPLVCSTLLTACGNPYTTPTAATPPPASHAIPVATVAGRPLAEPVSKRIGPAGGSLESADRALTVIVPAGAFAADTFVSIQEISNEAHGSTGKAYRIRPEGLQTAVPMTLRFRYSEEDLAGTALANLGIATQAADKTWDVYRRPVVDTRMHTLSVRTSHFSDWSKVRGAQLLPGTATVKVNSSVALRAVVCVDAPPEVSEDDLIVPEPPSAKPAPKPRKIHKCESFAATNARLTNWAVNGSAGGNGATGTVSATSGPLAGTARYTAPNKVPASNPVAVSVDLPAAEGLERQTLVSMIKVIDRPTLYAFVEMEGEGYKAEGCEGGEWRLAWDGPVAVAPESDSDLMRNYTAFDTTSPLQENIEPATFSSTPLVCRSPEGQITMRADVEPKAANNVKLSISLAKNEETNAQSLIFSASDLGACRTETGGIKMAADGLIVHIDTTLTEILSPALDISLEDLKKGFHKSYALTSSPLSLHPLCMGFKLRSGRIILLYEVGE
jgi:hypothetical protein